MKEFLSITLATGLLLCGCSPKPAETTSPVQETKVQNAYTDHVDRGITAMNNAQKASDTAAAKNAELEQQSKATEGL